MKRLRINFTIFSDAHRPDTKRFRLDKRRPCWAHLALTLTLLFTGCETDSLTNQTNSGTSAEESKEGYGHDRPPHKPDDLPHAVAEIERRWEALLAGAGSAGSGEMGESKKTNFRRELEEILIWLPELAAETDLRRAEWERVHALSNQLLTRFQHSFLSSDHRSAPAQLPPGEWRDAWQQLAEIAATLPPVQPTNVEMEE